MPYFVMDLVLYEDGESHAVEDVAKSDITEDLVYLWFKDVAEALAAVTRAAVGLFGGVGAATCFGSSLATDFLRISGKSRAASTFS